MEIFSLPPDRLMAFIERTRKFDVDRYETYLHSLLVNVLSELTEFVPSEGVMMLLDDPRHMPEARERDLTYVATAGKNTQSVLGKKLPATSGVIGETYTLGKPAVRKADRTERIILDKTNFPVEANSLISVPLKIETTMVGVLLLYNKKDPVGFTIRDLKLVEIFAAYISMSLQNAVDARKSKELTKKDDLTGLFNDRFFHAQLEIEVKRADEKRLPLSLLFMDLDRFKEVNDLHGHLVGSHTLKEVGYILREAIDDDQCTVARYGGDEYVVVLPGMDLEAAVDRAERIRLMIHVKLFMIDQGEHDGSFINFKGLISASIGVASLQDHVPTGGTLKERKNFLIRLADAAMYKAKENGKNCVCVADPRQMRSRLGT